MAKRKYPLIHIEGCQIKSAKKLKIFCKCIEILEEEIGIKEVEISLKDVFICPWIDLTKFTDSSNETEKLIGGLLIKLDIMKHGEKSAYSVVPVDKIDNNG